jgi:hypothetical protein
MTAHHTDRPTISELYPTALQWLWQGYPIEPLNPTAFKPQRLDPLPGGG